MADPAIPRGSATLSSSAPASSGWRWRASLRSGMTASGSRSWNARARSPRTRPAHQRRHPRGDLLRPGSLKARLCVAGARGAVRVLRGARDSARERRQADCRGRRDRARPLDELERRGHENGSPDCAASRRARSRRSSRTRPASRPSTRPATGVVDFARVAASYGSDLAASGGSVATGGPVRALEPRGARSRSGTPAAPPGRQSVSCAGAWSDRLAVACGAPAEPRIVPFRGGYLRLRPERRELVRANIYPVPDPDLPFLGVHLTRGRSTARCCSAPRR